MAETWYSCKITGVNIDNKGNLSIGLTDDGGQFQDRDFTIVNASDSTKQLFMILLANAVAHSMALQGKLDLSANSCSVIMVP